MRTRLAVVLVAAALQSSCLLLPGYEETGCGDSILGMDEDCDGRYAPEGGTCAAPDAEHACHYICNGAADVSCPAGWGCGLDGRCYKPYGSFDDPDPGVFLPIRVGAIGDLDGDGYADLLGNSDTTLSVRFNDGEGQFSDSFLMSIPRPTGQVWFAPLDSDASTDALIPLGPALLAFAGQSARDLDSFLFPSITLPERLFNATGAVVESEVPDLVADSEMLLIHDLMVDGELRGRMEFLDPNCPNNASDGIPLPDAHTAAELAPGSLIERTIATADIDRDGISEFALPFPGTESIYLFSSDGALTCPLPAPYAAMPQVPLPPGMTLTSLNLVFAHLDGDDLVDLLIPVTDGAFAFHVAAAHSLGDGTFAPASILPELDVLPEAQRIPLAAADLDGNGLADYVTPGGIYLAFPPPDGSGPGELVLVAAARQTAWLDAEIIDVNGDGALDVVATSAERGIDWLVNAGPIGPYVRFNRFLVDTAFRPTHLRSGDFNGDQLSDILVLEEISSALYELTLVFSTPSGVPGAGVRSGRVPGPIWFIDPSQIPELNTSELDGVTDVFIMNDLGPGQSGIYALQGSTAQQLISPFLAFPLPQEPDAENPVIVAAPVGDFLGDASVEPTQRRRFIAAVAVPEEVFRAEPGNGEIDVQDAVSSLVLMASSPAGELSQINPSVRLGPLSEFNAKCAVWLTGDLDGGSAADEPARDELVAVESPRLCPRDKFDGGLAARILRFPGAAGPGGEAPASTIVELPSEYVDIVSARLADLDGDQKRDVLLFGVTATSEWIVTILWNDDGCSGDPSACLAETTRLVLPDQSAPGNGAPGMSPIGDDLPDLERPMVDVVPVQLSGDARPELAVLYYGFGENLLIFEALTATRDFALDPLPGYLPLDLGYAARVSAADVNGDGLDDLLIGLGELTNVFLQISAPPLGAGPDTGITLPEERTP